jgi:hypothetical protein
MTNRATGLCSLHTYRNERLGSPTGKPILRPTYTHHRRVIKKFLTANKRSPEVVAAFAAVNTWLASTTDVVAMRLKMQDVSARIIIIEVLGVWLLVRHDKLDGDELTVALGNACLRRATWRDDGYLYPIGKVKRRRSIKPRIRRSTGAFLRAKLSRVLASAIIWLELNRVVTARYLGRPQQPATLPAESE